MKKQFIELKNIQHLISMSEVTPCYEASLYVDDKRFARVSNDGKGRADKIVLEPGVTQRDFKALNTRIAKSFPKVKFLGESFSATLESVCHDLLQEALWEKDLRKALKGDQWLFISDTEVLAYDKKAGQKIEEVVAAVRQENKNAVLLNDLPFEEALAKFIECAEKIERQLAGAHVTKG